MRTSVKTKRRKAASSPNRVVTKKVVVKEPEPGLVAAVHVSACFERIPKKEQDDDGDDIYTVSYPGKAELCYGQFLRKLFIDQFGNLVANGSCDNGVFICTREELPALAAFINQLYSSKV